MSDLVSKYKPNLALDRLPLNEHTIKWFGIDFDNLSNEEIQEKLQILEKNEEDVFIDYENRFIYTGVLSFCDDDNYFLILKDLKIPLLGDLEKILEPIDNDSIRNDLIKIGVCKILAAQYEAKEKIFDVLITNANNQISVKNNSLDFNPNNFCESGYNLYCYLIDNYEKKGIIKFVNIYFFLRDEVKKDVYTFRFTQYDYKIFIANNYDIEIKKFQKATFDYDEQKRVLNSLEEQFRKQQFK